MRAVGDSFNSNRGIDLGVAAGVFRWITVGLDWFKSRGGLIG